MFCPRWPHNGPGKYSVSSFTLCYDSSLQIGELGRYGTTVSTACIHRTWSHVRSHQNAEECVKLHAEYVSQRHTGIWNQLPLDKLLHEWSSWLTESAHVATILFTITQHRVDCSTHCNCSEESRSHDIGVSLLWKVMFCPRSPHNGPGKYSVSSFTLCYDFSLQIEEFGFIVKHRFVQWMWCYGNIVSTARIHRTWSHVRSHQNHEECVKLHGFGHCEQLRLAVHMSHMRGFTWVWTLIYKWHKCLLTWHWVTLHSCIFTMTAVVDSNAEMGAVSQACLSPIAGYVVIVDWTTACTKVGFSTCRCGSAVVELLADHIGISDVPTVITHSAPCAIVVHLHTSFTVRGTSHQSDCSICRRRDQIIFILLYKITGYIITNSTVTKINPVVTIDAYVNASKIIYARKYQWRM